MELHRLTLSGWQLEQRIRDGGACCKVAFTDNFFALYGLASTNGPAISRPPLLRERIGVRCSVEWRRSEDPVVL